MPVLRLTITADIDGVSVPGFPIVRRAVADEAQSFDYEKISAGGFVAVPTGELAEIQALLLRSDQPVTLRLDGQSDAGIVLTAGGVIVLLGVDIDIGAATNVTVENTSGTTAKLRGVAIGT